MFQLHELCTTLDSLCAVENTRLSHTPVRANTEKQPAWPADHPCQYLAAHNGFYRQIVNCAAVDDPQLCQLISWYLNSWMDHIVVFDPYCSAQQKIDTYYEPRSKESRNIIYAANQNKSKLDYNILPHQRSTPPLVNPPGNPRYVFNLLRWTGNAEEQRYVIPIFKTICGDVCVVDSMEAAHQYRALLVQNSIRAPTMLCLEEMTMLSSANVRRYGEGSCAPEMEEMNYHFAYTCDSIKRNLDAWAVLNGRAREMTGRQTQIDNRRQSLREGMAADHIYRDRRLRQDIDELQRECNQLDPHAQLMSSRAQQQQQRMQQQLPNRPAGPMPASSSSSVGTASSSSGDITRYGAGAQLFSQRQQRRVGE